MRKFARKRRPGPRGEGGHGRSDTTGNTGYFVGKSNVRDK